MSVSSSPAPPGDDHRGATHRTAASTVWSLEREPLKNLLKQLPLARVQFRYYATSSALQGWIPRADGVAPPRCRRSGCARPTSFCRKPQFSMRKSCTDNVIGHLHPLAQEIVPQPGAPCFRISSTQYALKVISCALYHSSQSSARRAEKRWMFQGLDR